MEYIEPLILIAKVESTDSIGNVVFNETQRKVFVKKNKVGTREFYDAVSVGLTPTAELQIRNVNYNGENEVIYKNKHYSVIRTIPKGKFDTVLVIGEKAGVK